MQPAFPQVSQIVFSPTDRVLVLAPHPDDEVIACAGIIQEALARKLPVKIVFLTNGDNNEWAFLLYQKHPVVLPGAVRAMGSVRQREAVAAAGIFGLDPSALSFLGYPDFGTLTIWRAHWKDSPAYTSMLTKARAVPYRNSYRPGAAYKGEEILADIRSILQSFKPTKVFVSHPGDHNPDHAALYLFTQIALWDLRDEIQPEKFPYLVHYRKWPRPSGWHPDESLNPPEFFSGTVSWIRFPLEPSQVSLKRSALRMHRSQYLSSASYLLSFVRRNELFGVPFPAMLSAQDQRIRLFDTFSIERSSVAPDTTEKFAGISRESVERKGDALVFSFEFRRPIVKEADTYIYCFGYRRDVPFRDMPKIQIRLGLLRSGLYDQRKKIPFKNIQVTRKSREITVTIPLSLLGDPQLVMTSATAYLGEVSQDWPFWHSFEVPA